MLALTGDIRRLFNNANMKLDAPTIKQILAALKKAPLDTQLAAQPTKPAAGAFPLALSLSRFGAPFAASFGLTIWWVILPGSGGRRPCEDEQRWAAEDAGSAVVEVWRNSGAVPGGLDCLRYLGTCT